MNESEEITKAVVEGTDAAAFPEEAKPVGEAIIVDTEPVVEQFPAHDETTTS